MTAVIDFETFFDTEYSLKRMTTEEYIRDPRFKIHCVAVVTQDTKIVFTDNFAENLAPYMDDFVVCQHSQFDGLILSHHLGLYPAYWGDTLSMARALLQNLKSHSLESLTKHFNLPQKTIDYNAFRGKRDLDDSTMQMLTSGCLHDADLTYTIASILMEQLPPQELQIIDLTIRMFTEPCLCLDVPRLMEELDKVKAAKANALENLGVTKEDLQSAAKFSSILESYGVLVPTKVSPKTGKVMPALAKTDEGMKALLESEDEIIAALAAARLGQKSTLMETRCERFLGMFSRGYMPVYLKYHGAHTGRFSGGDKVNWQNLISALRKCILAPDGYKIVGADSAQIECRLLNWFAGQHNIVQAFRDGRDIYSELASIFFGRTITKANEEERKFGKEIELASGYNMGWLKFQLRVFQKMRKRLTDEEAKRAITVYRESHPQVVGLWKRFQQVIEDMGKGLLPYKVGCVTIDGYKIIMPNDAYLDYAGLYYDGESYRIGDSNIYGGKVVENIIQKLALIVVTESIARIDNTYGYKLVTTTHDDVLYVVPEQDNTALSNVLKEMKTPPEWGKDIPLGAEGFENKRYAK